MSVLGSSEGDNGYAQMSASAAIPSLRNGKVVFGKNINPLVKLANGLLRLEIHRDYSTPDPNTGLYNYGGQVHISNEKIVIQLFDPPLTGAGGSTLPPGETVPVVVQLRKVSYMSAACTPVHRWVMCSDEISGA